MEIIQWLVEVFEFFESQTGTPEFAQQAVGFVVFGFVVYFCLRAVLMMRINARRDRATAYERIFTNDQKAVGHHRAGYRCEFSNGMQRCVNPAEHADHFFPYSRGGATSMQNFVSACSAHNLAKSAKMPSAVEKGRIEARRRNYFPSNESIFAGEWA